MQNENLNWHLFAMQNICTSRYLLLYAMVVARRTPQGTRHSPPAPVLYEWCGVCVRRNTCARPFIRSQREIFFMQFKHSSLSYELVYRSLNHARWRAAPCSRHPSNLVLGNRQMGIGSECAHAKVPTTCASDSLLVLCSFKTLSRHRQGVCCVWGMCSTGVCVCVCCALHRGKETERGT